MTVKNWIREFAIANPGFTSNGFECPPERFAEWRAELFTIEFELMVCTATIFLTEKLPRCMPGNLTKLSSYTQKHLVEQWVRENNRTNYAPYIRNGALIIAASTLSYEPVRRPFDGANCTFKKIAPALARPGR